MSSSTTLALNSGQYVRRSVSVDPFFGVCPTPKGCVQFYRSTTNLPLLLEKCTDILRYPKQITRKVGRLFQ